MVGILNKEGGGWTKLREKPKGLKKVLAGAAQKEVRSGSSVRLEPTSKKKKSRG